MEFFQEIAKNYRDIWLILHLFAMVIGLGGATYTDILLVTFLKDFKIDKKEKEVVHTMSAAVTVGVFLALFSGVMLFWAKPEELLSTPKFIAKSIIFAVIMINGFLLHRLLLPKLLKFNFKCEHYIIEKFLHLRHLGFIMGAISGVSWYSVFLLGAFSRLNLTIFQILGTYAVTLFAAITVALLIERTLKSRC